MDRIYIAQKKCHLVARVERRIGLGVERGVRLRLVVAVLEQRRVELVEPSACVTVTAAVTSSLWGDQILTRRDRTDADVVNAVAES